MKTKVFTVFLIVFSFLSCTKEEVVDITILIEDVETITELKENTKKQRELDAIYKKNVADFTQQDFDIINAENNKLMKKIYKNN